MFFAIPPPLMFLCLASAGTPQPDEQSLSARIRDGDHQAFKAFFERHHEPLYAFLRRRGVPAAVAEDLVQQAFVSIWERRQQIDGSRSLRALLFRIGYTRALNHFRDTSRFVDPNGGMPQAAVTTQPDPDAAAVMKSFDRAVAALPERRRAVFELCFLQQLTYREAAQVLGISIKTVEHQMGHALKAIRKALEEFRLA